MRILAAWNEPDEADLLALYLNVDENHFRITQDAEEFVKLATGEPWDVALMSLTLPDLPTATQAFNKVREAVPELPIVGACFPQEVFHVAKFMRKGMRSYVLRDAGGDFLFLVQTTLESTVAGVKAEREQKISERLREEIDSVRKIQETVLPHDIDCPAGYAVCARYESSQIQVIGGTPVVMAGGDYYDVFSPDEKTVVLLVGDASGHGMKACMSIMIMHTLMRMIRSAHYSDTASFVAEINRQLCTQSVVQGDGGFITLLYGVLRTDRHEFQWTSAGHPIPLLQLLGEENGSVVEAIGDFESAGLPLGIYPEAEYETCTIPIPVNSRLLLYSDGLAEAFPAGTDGHEEFGVTRISETLKKYRQATLNEAMQALFDESHKFTGGFGRHDDTSVVLLERPLLGQ